MSEVIKRFVCIEIPLQSDGQNNFPDQSQLRGAIIDSVVLFTPDVAAVSAVTGSSNIASLADLQNCTISLLKGSDTFSMNMPILTLNAIASPTGTTPYQFRRELFFNQIIDWNQCYIKLKGAPSAANCIVSIGVYYFWPNGVQPTI